MCACLSAAAMKENLPFHHAARRVNDLEDGTGCDAFAATTFAHDPQYLTSFEVKAHPIDRPHNAVVGEELGFEVFDFEQEIVSIFHQANLFILAISAHRDQRHRAYHPPGS
jgi:hypothetical protein